MEKILYKETIMEKMSLVKILRDLYKIAWQKEFISGQYNQERKKVHCKLDELKEAKTWQRLIVGVPIGVIMYIFCHLAVVYYMSAALGENGMIMHTIFKYMFFASLITGIVLQVKLSDIIAMTKWYKEQEAVLLAKEGEMQKKYRILMAAKTREGMDVFPMLGRKYLTTDAIGNMIEYLKNGQADSIKELITIYEKDCRRARV